MSKNGLSILNTLFVEGVITLSEIEAFLDNKKKKKADRLKSKTTISKPDKRPDTYVDPCSHGGGYGRLSC